MSDVFIKVEHVSKKYCRGLKRSLWYGVRDIASELTGRRATTIEDLRPGEFYAVKDLSFELRRGECLGLIGPNGAGKSTLLKLLNGLIKPDSGRIQQRGRLGALIELGAGFHPLLTGRENIYINGAILGMKKREISRRLDEIIDFAEIDEAIDTPVRTYSSGMRVRLGFAVAAHLEPDVLLIDEVLAVGDARFRLKCFNHMNRAIEQGLACILVSHDVNLLTRVCTRGLVINEGQIVQSSSLSKAIACYESLGVQRSTGPSTATDAAQNSSIIIKNVETFDENGVPQQVFASRSTVLLRVNYSSQLELPNVTVMLRFGSVRSNDIASFTNRVLAKIIPVHAGNGRFTVRLIDVPFLAGSYYVRVGIFDEQMETMFDQKDLAGSFSIDSPMPDPWGEYYTLRLNHSWGEGAGE